MRWAGEWLVRDPIIGQEEVSHLPRTVCYRPVIIGYVRTSTRGLNPPPLLEKGFPRVRR